MPNQEPTLRDYDDWDDPPPPRIFFSGTEIAHLLASVAVLTAAFALVLGARDPESLWGFEIDWALFLGLLPYSAIAVVPAFILHELAHKVIAQRRDMWAEFRANGFGLTGGFVLTAWTGILFAIPGAVHIIGHADKRDAGVISIWGPLVNLVIGYGALLLEPLFPPVRFADKASLFEVIVLLNAVLAAFNMLPIGPLDGRKVWRWSKVGFLGMWALVLALVLLYLS